MPGILAAWSGLARLLEQHPDQEGAVRLLVGLRDGQTVESVLLAQESLCVSTQVGCAVGCVFCMTGKSGLQRQLGSAELVALGEAYARRTHHPIQYQWTLIEGVNDDEADLEGIVPLLRGRYAVLNLIPYNAEPGLPFLRPSPERVAAIVRGLRQRGVLTTLRHSAGQDVEAGCGQLRLRRTRR